MSIVFRRRGMRICKSLIRSKCSLPVPIIDAVGQERAMECGHSPRFHKPKRMAKVSKKEQEAIIL
jgi:hypothetical protein